MSSTNSNLLQTIIAQLPSSRSSGKTSGTGSYGVQEARQDLWASKSAPKELQVSQGATSTEITTPGGYKIIGYGKSSADGGMAEIVSPDGKTRTKIWGDPHVDQINADGTSERQFDIKARTTMVLPDNTVITLGMSPSTNGTDTTMLSSMMVSNGDKGVLLSDMMSGEGKMTTDEGYGPLMDSMVGDGNVLNMGKDGKFYEVNEFGGMSKVTQTRIDNAERELGDGVGDPTQASDAMLSQSLSLQIQKLLSGLNKEFLSTLQSASFTGYSSAYPRLGMFDFALDKNTSTWS